MRILHVTECFEGGVSRAITSRVEASPAHEHHLLYAGPDEPHERLWASTTPMRKHPLRAFRDLRRAAAAARPHVIHAHSSWAGVLTRLWPRPPAPIVYEPHCFKFDDPALSPAGHFMVRSAEAILARRTAVFGVLSSHEGHLARSLRSSARTVFIPNLPTVTRSNAQPPPEAGAALSKIVMVGRLSPEKEPAFFMDVVNALRQRGVPLEAVWAGDGDAALRDVLVSGGVRVTGWLSPAELAELLRGAVYVHSSRYEGMPLSLLDAAACDCPIVARRIPALQGLPVLQSADADRIAEHIERLTKSAEMRQEASESNAALLRRFAPARLSEQLEVLYRSALTADRGRGRRG
ncbi:glycosyltransferase family 4 protein [Leucobacter sp. USHLN153]|uniref:glycosyltransferase family 4 protein n=1 Tax=Leucobacter sp. USHLN153 TaxID=3081268 RepID=UPI00301B4114